MKPTRNIPVTINVVNVDVQKQRLEVSLRAVVNELSFVNKQRIQFFNSEEPTQIYVGTYKTFNGVNYIENIESNVENFFDNINTQTTFVSYDYAYFWLPNQENFLTLKMVYDFFKDKSSPSIIQINPSNGIDSRDNEESMVGFLSTIDKFKLDNTKVYVKSSEYYGEGSQRTFLIKVNNYRQFDVILFGDTSVCQMNCCFSSSNDLSIVFVHNNFNSNITISCQKMYNEDETYIKLTINGDNTKSCIIGIENFENIVGRLNESVLTKEIIAFNNGLETIEITPKTFKVDKQRMLSFEDSSNGAIEIEKGTDLKNILKSGEYYCINNIDISNKPEDLSVGFTLLCYSNGYDERPTRYEIIDNNGCVYTGKYNNGTIEWKKLLDELPEHTHTTKQIITNDENQFISESDRIRWNNMSGGSSVWTISHDIVSPEQNTWNIKQELLKKEFLYVSTDLDLIIESLQAGNQGLIVVKNLAEESINVSLDFNSVSTLMLGVDTNLESNDSTITVPVSKAIEIYYMRLDANNLVCKIRLLNVLNISSKDYKVVGEEADLVIQSI